jgi:hypothetical protein
VRNFVRRRGAAPYFVRRMEPAPTLCTADGSQRLHIVRRRELAPTLCEAEGTDDRHLQFVRQRDPSPYNL